MGEPSGDSCHTAVHIYPPVVEAVHGRGNDGVSCEELRFGNSCPTGSRGEGGIRISQCGRRAGSHDGGWQSVCGSRLVIQPYCQEGIGISYDEVVILHFVFHLGVIGRGDVAEMLRPSYIFGGDAGGIVSGSLEDV